MAHQTEQFPVRNRWTDRIQFTAEITCAPDASTSLKLGLAVQWGLANSANLSRANLSRANLYGANLSRANLSGANLSRANLYGANLSRANLSDANLSWADLSWADLSDANLSDANLSGANLSWANLSGANLSWADLSWANLSGANLSEETLRPFKTDLWATLIDLRSAPLEITHLIHKLRAGEVDGSTYSGGDSACACLVGTLAQPRGVAAETLDHNSSRPAERWFMMIRPGDKPELETGGGFAARKALEWTLELCSCLGFDPERLVSADDQARAA